MGEGWKGGETFSAMSTRRSNDTLAIKSNICRTVPTVGSGRRGECSYPVYRLAHIECRDRPAEPLQLQVAEVFEPRDRFGC